MTTTEELAERLRTSVGRFARATRAHADSLPTPHASALGLLVRHGDLSIAALAQRRGVRHQSMSRAVAELEAEGYVRRRPNPADGRGFLISVTGPGRAALDRDLRARRNWIAAAVNDLLSPEERARLGDLPALLDRLSAYGSPGEHSEHGG